MMEAQSLERLPEDVLVRIVSLLPFKERLNLRRVNSRIESVITQPSVLGNIRLHLYRADSHKTWKSVTNRLSACVVKLYVNSLVTADTTAISRIEALIWALPHVEMVQLHAVHVDHVLQLIPSLKSLDRLCHLSIFHWRRRSQVWLTTRTEVQSFLQFSRPQIRKRLRQCLQISLQRLEFEVWGKVQGVFLRQYTKRQADALGLTGWCRNTNSGSVRGEVEGPAPGIAHMQQWLATKGSPKARIKRTQFNLSPIDKLQFSEFEIIY